MRSGLRRTIAIMAMGFASPAAAQERIPAAVVAAQLPDGTIDPDATDWLRGAFTDATPEQRAIWTDVQAWLSRCHADGLAVIRRELSELGIANPRLEGQVAGDRRCQTAKMLLPHAFSGSTFDEFQRADTEIKRVLAIYRLGAQNGYESAPFDPAWSGKEGWTLMRATVFDQVYRRAFDLPETVISARPEARAALMRRVGHAVTVTDLDNTRMLKAHITEHGWPTIERVGALASHKAWLLVQHADHDPAFQLRALRMMEPLAAKGGIRAANYAYLYDRVMLKLTGRQRFSTQIMCEGGKRVPRPIEDGIDPNLERTKMGLGPLSDYVAGMNKHYAPCPA